MLAETIAALRAIWAGEPFAGEHVRVAAAMAVTDGAPVAADHRRGGQPRHDPVGCEHADGVNLLPDGDLAERVAFARGTPIGDPFEVSAFGALDVDHPLGGDPAELAALGVDRRTLYVGSPFPLDAIAGIAAKLRAWNPASG